MRYLILFAFAGALFGQGTEPKPKVEDYEVHARAKDAALGAEFTVHSFSRGEQSFLANDYLVVEVAFYPPKDTTISVQNANFTLRINGKKELLQTVPPTMVAQALNNPQWEQPTGVRPEVAGTAGTIGAQVGLPPRNTNPFPGSQPPGSQLPPRVDVPPYNPTGADRHPLRPEEVLLQTALVEGEHHAAFSGFLYFPYRGKITAIKTLELLYEDAVLKLR